MKKIIIFSLILVSVFSNCKKDEEENTPAVSSYELSTGDVQDISNTSAAVKGSIGKVEGKNVTMYGHVWSTAPNPTVDLSTKTEIGSTTTDIDFTSVLSSLQRATTYYVRTYATDASGTSYGPEINFQTKDEFFKFNVSSIYLSEQPGLQTEAWIMLYTDSGAFLDMREIENGKSISFDWPAKAGSDTYTVQILTKRTDSSYYSSNVNIDYYLSIYPGIEPETWLLGGEPMDPYTPIGENTIIFNDIDLQAYDIYEAYNLYTYGLLTEPNQMVFTQYFDPDNIFIMFMNMGEAPYYKWFGNVGLNENFNVSQNDVTQMTDYVDISFAHGDGSFVYIESQDDPSTEYWEYFTVYYNFEVDQSVTRAYYPGNLFDGYYTYLRATGDNYSEYITKYHGSIPSDFDYMEANITATSYEVDNYACTTNGEFDMGYISWMYSIMIDDVNYGFWYDVYGDNNSFHSYYAPDLPQEVADWNEPVLAVNNLEYNSYYIYDSDALNNYHDYVADRFVKPGYLSHNRNIVHRKYYYDFGKKKAGVPDNPDEFIKNRLSSTVN